MNNTMNNDTHIILDKELRRDIDAIIQKLKNPPPSDTGYASISAPSEPSKEPDGFRRSRERSLAITKLQEAVMWLGMDLKAINEESPGACENPYPNSKDPTNTKVDPTADGLKL